MSNELAIQEVIITDAETDLIKRTIAPDATDAELQLFFYDNKRRGVHPLDKLIHFTKRNGKYTPITSIDFMRMRSIESGSCAGNDDPIFSGQPKTENFQAKVTVYRLVQGQKVAFSATARWSEYYPGDKQGFMWNKMPHVMLGKVAEALALRKAFPQELSGLYASEEMVQAGPVIPQDQPSQPEVEDLEHGKFSELNPNKSEPEPEQPKDSPANAVISEPQRKRLYAIGKKAEKTDEQMKAIVKRYGYESSKDILRTDYEAICQEMEVPF